MRRIILSQGRRTSTEDLAARSQRGALRAARRAARDSPAYRELLKREGIAIDEIGKRVRFDELPVLTKARTFGGFSLAELARPFDPRTIADVLTSSGRGGRSFGLRLTTRKAHEAAWFHIDLGLQDLFAVDQIPTLLINCLPMGVVVSSRAVTVANVSVREDMACSILRDVGPHFGQSLICTDPLFVRRLIEEADRVRLDWQALRASLILGEETLVESQRDYLASAIGIDLEREPHRMIGSSFGVGELGLNLLFETRETIRLRRAARTDSALRTALFGASTALSLPSVFCVNPLRCHVEVLNPDRHGYGRLCFTLIGGDDVIPLPRFETGDVGRIAERQELSVAAGSAGLQLPWLPVLVVSGREADRSKGDMLSVESVKELLYSTPACARVLTGAFKLALSADGSARLLFQAIDENLPLQQAKRVARELEDVFDLHGISSVHAEVVSAAAFPWRPVLDFERKFSYCDQQDQHASRWAVHAKGDRGPA
jgi:phenylacetate-CoA ligase